MTSAEPDVVIGQKLGDFVVEERVAHGGMGIVYRAVQPMIGRKVAVKVLRPEMATNQSQVDRFLAEARAISAITHRGIVDVFSFGTLPDGRQYMVMEFLEGEALDVLIFREGPLQYAQALPIFDEILDALSAAHGANVIHRDLKPSNVFISKQTNGTKVVKLVDFGLAKQTALGDLSTRTGERASLVGGTPEYISPEQIRGEAPVAQTDLYGLGVVMFEALTRRLPFQGETVVHTLEMHAKQLPPRMRVFRGDMPSALDDLVFRMMAKRVSDRPTSAQGARQELLRIMRELRIDGGGPREAPTSPSFTELPLGLQSSAGPPPQSVITVVGTPVSKLALSLVGAMLLAALAGAWLLGRSGTSVEPAPPLTVPAPAPAPVPELSPEMPVAAPAPVAPAPEVEPPAPTAPTGTAKVTSSKRRFAEWEASGGNAWLTKVNQQLDRDEAKLRAMSKDEPNRNAVTLLGVLRKTAASAATGAKRDRQACASSIANWEKQFLR